MGVVSLCYTRLTSNRVGVTRWHNGTYVNSIPLKHTRLEIEKPEVTYFYHLRVGYYPPFVGHPPLGGTYTWVMMSQVVVLVIMVVLATTGDGCDPTDRVSRGPKEGFRL